MSEKENNVSLEESKEESKEERIAYATAIMLEQLKEQEQRFVGRVSSLMDDFGIEKISNNG